MQPYFLPYVGYFQLVNAADVFVLYDNIKYTKKGWINRNRYLQNEKTAVFSVPLKADSDFLNIDNRQVSPNFDREKLLGRFEASYRKAPFFETAFPTIENIVNYPELNLFKYIKNSISLICSYLNLNTNLIYSSSISIDHELKGQDKVLAICDFFKADSYINAIGGQALYSKQAFIDRGINLRFIESKHIEYKQFTDDFVPWLSILDAMMFNSPASVYHYVSKDYSLVE